MVTKSNIFNDIKKTMDTIIIKKDNLSFEMVNVYAY